MNSSPNGSFQISKTAILLIAIIAFGAFMRLYNLEYMAFHHDESIHAYYSYKVFQGDLNAYKYDPTYHGPFLYHYGALFFVMFGDSDFTARLPFVSFGLLLLYFVYRLKPWIGAPGMICSLMMVAFSPTLTYFSRFARNDVYMAAMAMGIIVFALEYLRSKKASHLAWMTVFLALMYTCKENSYMTGFFLGSFAVFYGLYYVFSHSSELRPHAFREVLQKRSPFAKILAIYALFSCFAFSYVYYVTHHPGFKAKVAELRSPGEDLTIIILRSAWSAFSAEHASLFYIWIFTFLVIGAAIFIAIAWLGRVEKDVNEGSFFDRFAKSNLPVLSCVLIAVSIYTVLFTTLGSNRGGMQAGVVDYLLYWMGQQGDPRIPGPPAYYLPRLSYYELFPLLASIFAYFVYSYKSLRFFNFIAFQIAVFVSGFAYYQIILIETEHKWLTLMLWLVGISIAAAIVLGKTIIAAFSFVPSDLNENETQDDNKQDVLSADGFRWFLIYWSILSILVYALLEEKVPWLMVHQALPLCILGGTFVGDVWSKVNPGMIRYAYIFILVFFFAFQARTNIILNIYNPDNPRETMVYTQTSHMIFQVLDDIKTNAEKLGSDYMPPNAKESIVLLSGVANWPYSWYLRHYRTTPNYTLDRTLPPTGIPYVICEPTHEDRMKLWAKGGYTKRKFKHQEWWPPPGQSALPFNYFKDRGRKQKDAWGALLNYVLYRRVWEPNDPYVQPGSLNLLVYERTPMIKPEETLEVPAGYEQAPIPLQALAQTGGFGTGPGQFNEPRGVALTPDGSRIYVLDGKNARVQVFDSNLEYITYLGGPGSQIGAFNDQFNGPNGGIGIGPDGTLYVTDTWAEGGGRINRYQADGTPLPPIVRAGAQSFFFPRGLTVSSDGKLFVADTGNHRIAWFNADGQFGGDFAQGIIQEPVGVTTGPAGLIYVCDVKNRRIVSFSKQGQFVKQWPLVGWKTADESELNWIEPYVAVDNNGYVYATDSTTGTVHRFDPANRSVKLGGGQGTSGGLLNRPKGIAIDNQGNMYIADSLNHRVIKARFP